MEKDLDQSNKAAYADGTRRNLRVQWEFYLLFCQIPIQYDGKKAFRISNTSNKNELKNET